MAISLTAGGIPCQEIVPTLSGENSNNFQVSLPVGVICSVTIPSGVNWKLSLGGTCLFLRKVTETVTTSSGKSVKVLAENTYPILTETSGTMINRGPFFIIRLQ